MINRICWWLVETSSRMLDPDEQEAVRGDFAESGETGCQALRDVVGLVVRRQAAVWTDWRPWLALGGLVVPLGMLLSIVSKSTADVSAVYVWMYANNWDWDFLANRGFWYEFAHCIPIVFMLYVKLVCWSWTAGFMLGSISRRTVRVKGILFCLMLLFGVLLGAPQYFAYYRQYLHRALGLPSLYDPNAPVFALTFYRVMFPLIVQALLVGVPSALGMRQGMETARFRPLLRAALWTAAAGTLATMVVQNLIWLSPGLYLRTAIWRASQMRLVQVVVFWPVGYLVASAIRRHWNRKIAPA